MPTDRAPHGAKPLIGKVLSLIEEFPLPKQVEVAAWLMAQLRTNIIPDLRAEMKAAAKTNATPARSGARLRSAPAPARGGMSTAKRRLAAKKAAATRKARGTQRGGRPARKNSEMNGGVEATESHAAA